MPTMEQVVAKYVELRDRRTKLKDDYEAEDLVLSEAMDKLGDWLKAEMIRAGVRSANTAAGTAFFTTKDSARVADWDMLVKYAKENDRFDLFERRVSKSTVKEIMDQNRDGTFNNPPPPGVDYVRFEEIQINRPRK